MCASIDYLSSCGMFCRGNKEKRALHLDDFDPPNLQAIMGCFRSTPLIEQVLDFSDNCDKLRARYGALLTTGSEERGVLGVGSIPVAIPPSCYNNIMKTIAR